MQWMIAFKKLTMKKFKSLCLFTFFMLCLVEFGFSQNVHFQKDLTKKENLWYSGEELYTGEVITLSMDQIETRYSVEKGVPTGLFTKYFLDYTFKKSNYKDTSEIRRLSQVIVIENNKLNSLIKDSLMAYNDLISYINNEIGGDKKLLKLVVKKEENKLNEKQKVLMDNFAFKVNFWKNSSQNVLLSQQKIKLTNTKLKEEEAKPVFAPKISEQYEQVNSIKNGSYKSYFNYGRLKSEGSFLNGLYNGAWTYYYSNGNVQAKGSYVLGDGTDISEASGLPLNGRDGLWKIYHDNGKLSQESNFLKGKRNGSFKDYNTVGVLKEEAFYKNEVFDGERKLYYDSGKLEMAVLYNYGLLNGLATTLYENGNTKELYTYTKGNKDGVSKLFFENGKIQFEAVFKNDQKHGPFTSYYKNGNIQHKGKIDTNSLAESHFIGEIYSYNEDGTLKTKIMAYKDGRTEDLTPKPSSNLSKTEMSKSYKCRCCKSIINGVYNATSEQGEELSELMLDFSLNIYDVGGELLKKVYPSFYSFLRNQYPFCSMKCSKVCGK